MIRIYRKTDDAKYAISAAVNHLPNLCVFDDEGNIYDIFCKLQTFGGTECNPISKKCVMTEEQYKKSDEIVTKLRENMFKLPYDYTNDLLIVVDGIYKFLRYSYH